MLRSFGSLVKAELSGNIRIASNSFIMHCQRQFECRMFQGLFGN